MMAQEKQLAATRSSSTAMEIGLDVLTRDHRLGGSAAAVRAGRKKFINKLSKSHFKTDNGRGKSVVNNLERKCFGWGAFYGASIGA